MTAKVKDQETQDSQWRQLYARKLEIKAVAAVRFLRDRGIEPLLIKGWAAARNYPQHVHRFYTDVDLAVPASDFERAKSALFSEEGKGLDVDVHCELRHLDTKPWPAILDDSEMVDLDGELVRVPCPEDHLRIMATHWLNNGGEEKERLWDIFYAVANRHDRFSWDKCFADVGATRRQWTIAAIGLAHRYLGLDISGLPFDEEARDLPKWLTDTVEKEWRSGIRHRSLHTCLNDPIEFFRQLRKRFPPNPLQATIEMEGDLRRGSRLSYQLRTMKKRAMPSIKALAHMAKLRVRK